MRLTRSCTVFVFSVSAASLAGSDLDRFSDDACRHGRMEAAALWGGEARFDPGTGRNTRNYAPDRLVNHRHMRVEIDIPDMNTRSFSAVQTLDIAALATPVGAIRLNAEQLRIKDVELGGDGAGGRRITHFHDGSVLTVTFDPALEAGEEARLVTSYEVVEPVEGLFWTPESPAWPGRAAQIHSQGQPETNRYWFPCHDFPNERLTTEFVVTVPEGYSVISNGRLAQTPAKSGGRTTFHWVQDKPHVNYLVTLVVGKFDVTDVAPAGFPISLPVHVPPGKGGLVRGTYGRTAEMVKLFEERFDEPYPWDRYAQVVVWTFGSGGMENTSATTMYDTAIFDEKAFGDSDLDGLISHELAHQWTGDLITCNTWEHIWLNEGWATYGTALWYEHRDGYENGYLRQTHNNMRTIARADHLSPGTDEFRPGMASDVYEHPWEVFRRKSDPYEKGASILHMLRAKLGEEVFFKGVAAYIDRYKFKTAETDDFRRVLEEVSGVSLEQFFDQWCYRAGTPKVKVTGRWDEANKVLTVTVEQLQRIDADNPAFVFDLPIEVPMGEKFEPHRFTIPVTERRHTHTLTLDDSMFSRPGYLRVDPDLHVLMDLELDMPEEWLRRAAQDHASVVTRLDAVAALGSRNSPESVALLRDRLGEARSPWFERRAAADALGELKATGALLDALNAGIDDPRARVRALVALGRVEEADRELAAAVLARHAADEHESYACRAAALEALGKVGDGGHMDIFRAALKAESQHDQVRVGAIKGLATLDEAGCLEAVIPFVGYGNLSRTRPDAAGAIADLADQDIDAAIEALEPLLLDREARTRRAARQALAKIEDDRCVAALDSFIARTRHPAEKREAEELRKKLERKIGGE